MNMCLTLNGYRDRDVRISRLNFVRGLSMKSKVFERNVDTQDEFRARILDAASHIKEREVQLRRTKRDLRTRVANFIALDGRIFENLF
jgi:hypothetical protein